MNTGDQAHQQLSAEETSSILTADLDDIQTSIDFHNDLFNDVYQIHWIKLDDNLKKLSQDPHKKNLWRQINTCFRQASGVMDGTLTSESIGT